MLSLRFRSEVIHPIFFFSQNNFEKTTNNNSNYCIILLLIIVDRTRALLGHLLIPTSGNILM